MAGCRFRRYQHLKKFKERFMPPQQRPETTKINHEDTKSTKEDQNKPSCSSYLRG
jgi:hypothetical protein